MVQHFETVNLSTNASHDSIFRPRDCFRIPLAFERLHLPPWPAEIPTIQWRCHGPAGVTCIRTTTSMIWRHTDYLLSFPGSLIASAKPISSRLAASVQYSISYPKPLTLTKG